MRRQQRIQRKLPRRRVGNFYLQGVLRYKSKKILVWIIIINTEIDQIGPSLHYLDIGRGLGNRT